MNIILGASGQVGSLIVKELAKKNLPVRAIVRNKNSKFDCGVDIRHADFFNQAQLTYALEGGTSVFLLTPENFASNDIIEETKQLINNFKQAILANGIQKIVGLSSIGAHIEEGTGNILLSRLLEHRFDDLNIERVFIRPSYYFSNWLAFLEAIELYGVLATFFPADLKIHMNSPADVAGFISDIIPADVPSKDKKIFELVGPEQYNSLDVAEVFSELLNKKISVQPVPKEQWNETLKSLGFTNNTAENLTDMTQSVIDNVIIPENQGKTKKMPTTLYQYMKKHLNK